MTTINGWTHCSEPPPVDQECESDYLLVMGGEHIAPVVCFYANGRYQIVGCSGALKEPRWWKKLEPMPAFLFRPSALRWARESGLVIDETEKEKQK